MNYVTAKKPCDIKLAGIKVEFEKIGDRLSAVIFTDGDGSLVKINGSDYSSLPVLVPAPPKTDKRYVIRADMPVVGKVVRAFDNKYDEDAGKMRSDLDAKDIAYTDGEEEVVVDADNTPVSTVTDDIPF